MTAFQAVLLGCVLLVCSVTDLRRREIPDSVTAPAALCLVLAGLLTGPPFTPLFTGVVLSLLVALPLGALSLLRPGSFGMGDVKLASVITLATGAAAWLTLLPGLAIASGFGLVRAAIAGRSPGDETVPLAPFLALPGLAYCFWVVALQ